MKMTVGWLCCRLILNGFSTGTADADAAAVGLSSRWWGCVDYSDDVERKISVFVG